MSMVGEMSERTCVASRETQPREGLLRWFVGADGTPWPDWTGRAARDTGRGAWTAPTPAAIEEAVRAGAFARAFRTKLAPHTAEELVSRAVSLGTKGWYNRLGLANRARALAIGQVAAKEAFREGRNGLLIMADDAGDATQAKFRANASRKRLPVVVVRSGSRVGESLGKSFVSIVVVQSSVFAEDLKRWASQLVEFPSSDIAAFVLPVEGADKAPDGATP